jgi:hypothetical protein
MKQILLGAALAVSCSTAAIAGTHYAGRGPGVASCGTWTTEHQQGSIVASGMELWLMGYVTAYNRWAFAGSDVADGADLNGLVAAVSQYCAAHPLDSVSTASEQLIVQLIARDAAAHQ